MKKLTNLCLFATTIIFVANIIINNSMGANNPAPKTFYYIIKTDRSLNIAFVGNFGEHTSVDLISSTHEIQKKVYAFSDKHRIAKKKYKEIISKIDSIELLGSTGWKAKKTNGKDDSGVIISYINYGSSTSDSDFIVLDDFESKSDAKKRFDEIKNFAKSYQFSEQVGFETALPTVSPSTQQKTQFLNWSNSKYATLVKIPLIIDDTNGNNCNVFASWLIKQAGYSNTILPGNDVGNDVLPKNVTGYNANVSPWK